MGLVTQGSGGHARARGSLPGNGVLISSAGRRVELLRSFRSSMQALHVEGEVFAADASRLAAAFHLADRSFEVPACTDPAFVEHMLRLSVTNGVRLVVPTIDTELPAYADARDAFGREGITIAVSSPETIRICQDKIATHEWLVEHGFPTVQQSSLADAVLSAKFWGEGIIAKPRFGSAGIGVRRLSGIEELRSAAFEGDYVLQSLAPGQEYTVDVFVDRDGVARCAVPRLRLEVRAGEVSKGVTVRSSKLEGLASELCGALPGAYGVLTVQLFFDEHADAVNVIEVNPRFGGGFPLAWEAGARFPRWLMEDAWGVETTVTSDGWRPGLVMLRYDSAVFVDAGDVGVG